MQVIFDTSAILNEPWFRSARWYKLAAHIASVSGQIPAEFVLPEVVWMGRDAVWVIDHSLALSVHLLTDPQIAVSPLLEDQARAESLCLPVPLPESRYVPEQHVEDLIEAIRSDIGHADPAESP